MQPQTDLLDVVGRDVSLGGHVALHDAHVLDVAQVQEPLLQGVVGHVCRLVLEQEPRGYGVVVGADEVVVYRGAA